MTDRPTCTPTSTRQHHTWQLARVFVLIGGVINPIVFVTAYTVAGALRPGYSPIHQAISDLGVGRYGRLMDTIAATLLLILFAAGFAIIMKPVLSPGWRWAATALLVLRGLAGLTTATFTEALATVAIHHRGPAQRAIGIPGRRVGAAPYARLARLGPLLAGRRGHHRTPDRDHVLAVQSQLTGGTHPAGRARRTDRQR